MKRKQEKKNPSILDRFTKEKHIDSLQISIAIISLNELEKGEYNDRMKSLFAPVINPKNKTQKVYFTMYSQSGTKEDLESKIEAFNKMYSINDKEAKNYTIRKVKQKL